MFIDSPLRRTSGAFGRADNHVRFQTPAVSARPNRAAYVGMASYKHGTPNGVKI
jgi:hypothetical protein